MTRRPRRVARHLPKLYVAALLANGVRLRRRAAALPALTPVGTGGLDPDALPDGWVAFTAEGLTLPGPVAAAAAAHAHREGLDVVDLVPADLPVERALETLRMVAPDDYRTNPLAPGRGAFQAVLARQDVVARARLDAGGGEGLDPVQMVQVTTTLKRFAATSTDVVVAPGLVAAPDQPERRRAFLRSIYGGAAPASLVVQAAELAGLVAGTRLDPRWGSAAIAAYAAQPAVVFAGNGAGLRPRDLARHVALRLADDAAGWWRTLRSGWRSPAEEDLYEARRPRYDELLDRPIDRFFEPRRSTCPWCDSASLRERVRVPDRLQHKPGEFVLDECGDCGHIFQNPRLSIEGLDFYYEDFYDGIGGEQLEFIFGASARPYTGRAEMVQAHATPKRWLDVGAGHGHFCLVARTYWPDTVFDGLDMSESIEEAERRRWIDHGFRGMFPDLADELRGRYDVVSMHHYLEHTREPRQEIEAAATVLADDGLLLIELPDPESRWGRLLGGLWLPWFQPQHQHLMPIANLRRALEDIGFEIVAEDRGEAEQPVDLLAATWFLLDGAAPPSNLPWRPPGGRPAKVRRAAAFVAGVPALIVAVVLDNLLDLVLRRTGGGNTYRLLAVKRSPAG